jgi:hypothetical protein
MTSKSETPVFYLNGHRYTPTPSVPHLLLSDHNGDPTCVCGFTGAPSRTQMEAVAKIERHVREGGAEEPSGQASPAPEVTADPWGTPGNPGESSVVTQLRTARQKAWVELQPAFDIAIMQAKQAEHEADRATIIAMTGCMPAYSPLVTALAESVEPPRVFDPWNPSTHQ